MDVHHVGEHAHGRALDARARARDDERRGVDVAGDLHAALCSARTVIAYAAARGHALEGLDIENAFFF